MKNLYCVICFLYRKFEKPKIWCLIEKAVLSIICSKCKNEDEKIYKKKIQLKILGLIENIELL